DGPIGPGGGDPSSIWAERHVQYPVPVTCQVVSQVPRASVPKPDRTVPARGCDQIPVGVIADARERPGVTGHVENPLASCGVPEQQLARLAYRLRHAQRRAANRGEGSAIRAERHSHDVLSMALQGMEHLSGGRIPDADDSPPAHVIDLFPGRKPMTR